MFCVRPAGGSVQPAVGLSGISLRKDSRQAGVTDYEETAQAIGYAGITRYYSSAFSSDTATGSAFIFKIRRPFIATMVNFMVSVL